MNGALSEFHDACGGLNAKRQTPNAKRQTAWVFAPQFILKFGVWRLAFGVEPRAADSRFEENA